MRRCHQQLNRTQRAVLSRWPSRHGLAYDGLGRLVSESESGVDPASVGKPDDPNPTPTVTGGIYADGYTLDLTGNRLEKDHVDGVNAGNDAVDTYVYNADDELTAEADAVGETGGTITTTTTTYMYDANGATLTTTAQTGTTTDTVTDTYDVEGKLIAMTDVQNGSTMTAAAYLYDVDGNRISATVNGETTVYAVDENNPTGYSQVVEEMTAGGVIKVSYILGQAVIGQAKTAAADGRLADNALTFLLTDGHGSTRGLVTAGGVIVARYDYDAFGVSLPVAGFTNTAATNMLYAGQYFDAVLGQYLLRARIYDPTIGRFTTMDSYQGQVDDPVSLHKYIYAGVNPVINSDPSGMFFGSVIEFVVTQTIDFSMRALDAGAKLWARYRAIQIVKQIAAVGMGTIEGTTNTLTGPRDVSVPVLFGIGFVSGYVQGLIVGTGQPLWVGAAVCSVMEDTLNTIASAKEHFTTQQVSQIAARAALSAGTAGLLQKLSKTGAVANLIDRFYQSFLSPTVVIALSGGSPTTKTIGEAVAPFVESYSSTLFANWMIKNGFDTVFGEEQ